MNWLEQKYVNLLSYKLIMFKRKQSNVYNFRCPICLDSQKHKFKARGYIYTKKGHAVYHCHNCGVTMSIPRLLKTLDVRLYNEFMLEQLKELKPNEYAERMKKPVFRKEGFLKDLLKVSQLAPHDPVKQMVVARQIPNRFHALMFKCDSFMKFTNEIIPNKFDDKSLKYDGTRLLIPFLDREQKCFAYQGRAISDDKVRYITIIVDESEPKVYGLERMDPNRKMYVFEGPIDSMFIDNSIATAGSDMVSTLMELPVARENLIICYDNEKHSKETVAKINKAIDHNYKVVIYPDSFEYKDINEAILAGMNSSELNHILDHNIYSDLSARLRLSQYQRI